VYSPYISIRKYRSNPFGYGRSARSRKEEVIGRVPVRIEIAPVWAQITTQLPAYFPIDLFR